MSEICLMTKSWRSSAGWVAQMIAQAIAEQGATITYIAPRAEPESREPVHGNLVRVTPPRELVGEPNRAKRALASITRIGTGLVAVARQRLTTRNFIFSIPEPLVFTLPMFALLRLTGARVIFIVHDAQPHAWSLGPRLRFIERRAHALSYRLASVIVTLTPPVRDALVRDFAISPERIAVIPHGPLSVGDVAPLPGSGRLLLFGSLRRNKCVLEVIQGVVLARQRGLPVRLVLAGEPLKQEPGYWDTCLAAIGQDPEGFDVRAGFMPDEALPGLIGGVDAFVLAYRDFNSQSGVAILAALAGRPVIGTRSGGLGELFDQGMAGEILAEPLSAEAVADGVTRFCKQSPDFWRDAGEQAALRIAKLLRWDQIADDYIRLTRDGLPVAAPRSGG